MKPGINTEQTEVMDLSTSSAHYSKSQENEETNEEPSLLSIVRTPDHTCARNFEECEDEDQCEHEEVENPHYSSHINSSQSTTTTQQEEMESDCDGTINNTEYNEEEGSDVDQPPIPEIKKGKPFPTYFWDNLEPIECTEIPKNIKGFKKYIVHTSDDTWHDDMADSRYFKLKTFSQSKFKGVRKGCQCHGSWVCGNDQCGFKKTSKNHQPNYVNWMYVDNNRKAKICTICQ